MATRTKNKRLGADRPSSVDDVMAGWMGEGAVTTSQAMAVEGSTFQKSDNPEKLADLPMTHPYFNRENHQKLLAHCIERMQMSREVRDNLAPRFKNIDLDINGFVKLNDDDRQRMRDNRSGKGGQKPVDVSLPLADSKLDEMETFFAEVMYPNNNMYQGRGSPSKKKLVLAMTKALNSQSKRRRHYSKMCQFYNDALKYNLGAYVDEWVVEKGHKIRKTNSGTREKVEGITFEGNDIVNMDVYNLFWDTSVDPTEIAEKGEYFAYVELKSKYEIRKMAADDKIFGINRFINAGGGQLGTSATYYQEHPVVRFDYNAYSGSMDWMKFGAGGKYGSIGFGHELITMYIWIDPSVFGIVGADDKAFKIYRVKIANHLYITDVTEMNAVHEQLPLHVGVPFNDNLKMQHKSPAELLTDNNRLASFIMNMFQASLRKKLYGLTIYDPSIVDLSKIGTDVAARIPVNASGWGKKVDDAVKTFNDAPDTDKMPEQITQIKGIMDIILPTNTNNNVADMQRVTEYGAAAAVQGTNKRQNKMVRIVEDQGGRQCIANMISNIIQYQTQSIMINDPDNPDIEIEVTPSELAELDVEDYIGAGLFGVDRMLIIQNLKDTINMVIQNKEAIQEIDIVNLINYMTTLQGDDYDLNDFRRTQPTPQQQHDNQMETANTAANLAGTIQNGQEVQQQAAQPALGAIGNA